MIIYVQLKNDEVIATFGGPQDPEEFPGITDVNDDDERLKAYWEKWAEHGVQMPAH